MEFEDLKMVWDTQNNEQVFAINEKVLHQRVIRKNIAAKKTADSNEKGMMVISLFLALFMVVIYYTGHSLVYILQSIIFLAVATYIFMDRRKRLQNDGLSAGSILDDLNQAIRTNNYEIRRQKSMAWWFFIPVSAAMLLNLLRTTGIYSWAVVILMIAASTLGLIVQHRAIRPLMTKKDDLDALRKILIESENN